MKLKTRSVWNVMSPVPHIPFQNWKSYQHVLLLMFPFSFCRVCNGSDDGDLSACSYRTEEFVWWNGGVESSSVSLQPVWASKQGWCSRCQRSLWALCIKDWFDTTFQYLRQTLSYFWSHFLLRDHSQSLVRRGPDAKRLYRKKNLPPPSDLKNLQAPPPFFFAMKITGQPHRNASKLNFHWKICGIFFQGTPYKGVTNFKGSPFLHQVPLTCL